MEDVEASGKTVDEAIDKALLQLGLDRSQVDVEIVSEGRTGLFGLGGENARVLVKPLAGEQLEVESSTIQMAVDFLRRVLELMDIDAEVTARAPETPGDGLGRASAVLDVNGDDLGILIGRRGSTLAALQYMVNHMVSRSLKSKALGERGRRALQAPPRGGPHRPGPASGRQGEDQRSHHHPGADAG